MAKKETSCNSIKFTLNGKEYKGETIQDLYAKRVALFLNKLKIGELLSTDSVYKQVKLSETTFEKIRKHKELLEYRVGKSGKAILWGNKETIKKLKQFYGKD